MFGRFLNTPMKFLQGNLIFCSVLLCNDGLVFLLQRLTVKTLKDFFSFIVLFPHLIRLCCGFCASISVTQLFSPLEFSGALRLGMVDADFVYPVLGEKNSVTLYGYFFVRMIDVSDTLLITLKRSSKEVAMELLFACLSFWPLLMISSLLALIAGFFEWIIVGFNFFSEVATGGVLRKMCS